MNAPPTPPPDASAPTEAEKRIAAEVLGMAAHATQTQDPIDGDDIREVAALIRAHVRDALAAKEAEVERLHDAYTSAVKRHRETLDSWATSFDARIIALETENAQLRAECEALRTAILDFTGEMTPESLAHHEAVPPFESSDYTLARLYRAAVANPSATADKKT